MKDSNIVITELTKVSPGDATDITKAFVPRRKDPGNYFVEADGDFIAVHTPDPLVRSRGRKDNAAGILQAGALECPPLRVRHRV